MSERQKIAVVITALSIFEVIHVAVTIKEHKREKEEKQKWKEKN